jgi:mitochondrial Rho GTPase 1
VLVGNKIDLRGQDITNQNLEDEIIPIMNEFKVKIQQLYNYVTCF